ncbi:hypothetical protein ElyMa_004784300 [Elysia marginata]|uniref:Uncharacterized protein n=1 Tax=Elysia marginata TaxID=1093978 RepID=A0AAV4IEA5_9GAST|nr:hypothetical protein ElyMa_004784300 [Elysia marginata]
MQAVSEGSFPGQSTITFLPMIDMQPTNMSCIYSTLLFVSNLAAKYRVKPNLTFDQPLWWKSQLILNSEPADSHLRSLILQLGGFHTQMSYLGTIGHLMTGSGLRELLEMVYAPDAVVHMLSGKAVARAVRGHLLVDSVLNALLASSAFGVDLQSIVREEIDPARTATYKTREVSALHSEEMEGGDNSYSIRNNINDSSLSSCLQLFDQSSDSSDDDVPLQAIRGIRDLVEFKRKKAALLKSKEKPEEERDFNGVFADKETSNDLTTSPRKASEKARETMHAMIADDSGHLDLDDSDADPDFVPEKKKKKKNGDDDEEDAADFVLPDMVAHQASFDEHHDQGAQEVGDTRENRKRKCATERSKERSEKQKKKIEQEYSVKPRCVNSCKRMKKCCESFLEGDRLNINKHFWSLDYSGRRKWIGGPRGLPKQNQAFMIGGPRTIEKLDLSSNNSNIVMWARLRGSHNLSSFTLAIDLSL